MGKKRKISSNESVEPEDNEKAEGDEEEEEEKQSQDSQQSSSFPDKVESNDKVVQPSASKKKPTPGILYLSRIPNKMNVTIIRQYFDQYGQTGRIYLQLSSIYNLFFIFKE